LRCGVCPGGSDEIVWGERVRAGGGHLSRGFKKVWRFSQGLAWGCLSRLNSTGGRVFVAGIHPKGALSGGTFISVVMQNFRKIGHSVAEFQ